MPSSSAGAGSFLTRRGERRVHIRCRCPRCDCERETLATTSELCAPCRRGDHAPLLLAKATRSPPTRGVARENARTNPRAPSHRDPASLSSPQTAASMGNSGVRSPRAPPTSHLLEASRRAGVILAPEPTDIEKAMDITSGLGRHPINGAWT